MLTNYSNTAIAGFGGATADAGGDGLARIVKPRVLDGSAGGRELLRGIARMEGAGNGSGNGAGAGIGGSRASVRGR